MATRLRTLAVASCLSFLALAMSPVMAHPAAATTPDPTPPIFVVTTGDQNFENGVLNSAAGSAGYRALARHWAGVWQSEVSGGQTPYLMDLSAQTHDAELQSLTDLQARLNQQDQAGVPSFGTTSAPASRTSQSAPAIQASGVSGHDPNSFAVRGAAAGANRSYWTGMTLEIDGGTCTSTCQMTDRYVSKVTINPGAKTSKISATNLYFPNAGNFGNEHFEMWAINRGTIVGNTNTGQLPGGSVNYVSSSRALNGDVLTSAVTLWVYENPVGTYIADGAKTHDALCVSAPNNNCYY